MHCLSDCKTQLPYSFEHGWKLYAKKLQGDTFPTPQIHTYAKKCEVKMLGILTLAFVGDKNDFNAACKKRLVEDGFVQ